MHDSDDSAISHITSEGALSRPTDRPTDDIKKTSPLIELLKKTSRLLGNKHEKKDRVLFRRDSLRNRSRSSKRWKSDDRLDQPDEGRRPQEQTQSVLEVTKVV